MECSEPKSNGWREPGASVAGVCTGSGGQAQADKRSCSHIVWLAAVATAALLGLVRCGEGGCAAVAAAGDVRAAAGQQRQLLRDLDAVCLQRGRLGRVVGHQRHAAHAQVVQDVGSHAVVTRIHLQGGKTRTAGRRVGEAEVYTCQCASACEVSPKLAGHPS